MVTKDTQEETGLVPSAGNALATFDPETFREVIRENLGPGGLNPRELNRIKVPAAGGRVWSIPSIRGDVDEKEITGVLIHWADRRAFWREKFSGEGNPPDCSSSDGVRGFGNPGGACEVCPLAEFGSAVDDKGNPGKGQACKQIRQLFIVRNDGGLLPVVLSAPPTSLAPLRKYLLGLASEALPYWSVVTKLTLEKAKSGNGIEYSRVVAELVEVLEGDRLARMTEYRNAIRPALDRVAVEDADFRPVEATTPAE